jgi:hypothetical protein
MMRSQWPATLGASIVVVVFIMIVVFQLHPSSLPESNPIKAIMDAQATCSPLPNPDFNPKGSTYLMVLHFKSHAPMSRIYEVGLLAARARILKLTRRKIANATMALRDTCRHPVTQRTYIRSIRGGRDTLVEQPDEGPGSTTHAFIIEFDSLDHRNYFVDHDPAHRALKREVQPLLLQSPIIIDFTTGSY